jgi:TRAP-type C4-dicarboxylate transport system permease large subunit
MAEPARYSRWASIAARLGTIASLFAELRRSGLIWLLPLVVALLVLGLVLAAIASTGPLAPFLYPLL